LSISAVGPFEVRVNQGCRKRRIPCNTNERRVEQESDSFRIGADKSRARSFGTLRQVEQFE
jgi:hypothetical protein